VDGVETPLLPGGLYGQHYNDGLDGWPEWLAVEARLHDPDAPAAVPVPAADRVALRGRRRQCPDREPLLDVQCVKEAGHEVHSDRPGRVWYPAPADRAAEIERLREELDTAKRHLEARRIELLRVNEQHRLDHEEAPADRAAVLREAADAIALDRDGAPPGGGRGAYRRAMNRAEQLLRRLADESAVGRVAADTPPAEAQRVKHSGPNTKFCVGCLSGEHERVDAEPGPVAPAQPGEDTEMPREA
jgi:hypothetical protein